MTLRERYVKTLTFGEPDRIWYDFGHPRKSTLDAWYLQGLPRWNDAGDYGSPPEFRDWVGMDRGMGLPIKNDVFSAFEEKILQEDAHGRIWIDAEGITMHDAGKHLSTPGCRTRKYLAHPVTGRHRRRRPGSQFVQQGVVAVACEVEACEDVAHAHGDDAGEALGMEDREGHRAGRAAGAAQQHEPAAVKLGAAVVEQLGQAGRGGGTHVRGPAHVDRQERVAAGADKQVGFASIVCLGCGDPWNAEFRLPGSLWPGGAHAPRDFTIVIDRIAASERMTEIHIKPERK